MKYCYLGLQVSIAVVLAGVFAAPVYAEKTVYVDARRLVEESPQGKVELKKLEDAFSERGRELRGRIARFQAEEAELEKNQLSMPLDEVENRQTELREFQRNIAREQREYNEQYAKSRKQGLQELEEIISEVVIGVAEENEYDLVLQQAVYASEKIDITDQVLQALSTHHEQQ